MNERLEAVMRSSQLLYDNKFTQFRRVISDRINGYTFLHEIRCDGEIVSVLPYRVDEESGEFEFLVRSEATPCWEIEKPVLSSITGGVAENDTIEMTVIKELEEETGYKVYPENLIYLGECYGTKSVSTEYYIYSVDLTGYEQTSPLYIETELDEIAGCEWVSEEVLTSLKDPFIYVAYTRLMRYLFRDE